MIELGVKQKLTIINQTDFGVYLGIPGREDKVLLPGKQVPAEAKVGDSIEVFVYRDSSDRIISTVNEPALTLGETASLQVKSVSDIGAFLDWGLEKDLFLPFKEQTTSVEVGKSYTVALYIDKSNRLCATMKVYDYLREDAPYKKDEMVTGTIYELNDEFGVFVAVDNKYQGLIPKKEMFEEFRVGDMIEARVTSVREDGKLNLSVRQKAYLQMDKDSQMVLEKIKSYGGVLPFNDKADPEIIKKECKLSKNAFKRAVGRLLKDGEIKITESTIELETKEKNE